MKKMFVFIKRKNGIILSSEVPEIQDFLLTITGSGELGKVILQVSIAVFFGCRLKNFRAKMAQHP